jgi:hypothetical protein
VIQRSTKRGQATKVEARERDERGKIEVAVEAFRVLIKKDTFSLAQASFKDYFSVKLFTKDTPYCR